jgi:hypothetical protein
VPLLRRRGSFHQSARRLPNLPHKIEFSFLKSNLMVAADRRSMFTVMITLVDVDSARFSIGQGQRAAHDKTVRHSLAQATFRDQTGGARWR